MGDAGQKTIFYMRRGNGEVCGSDAPFLKAVVKRIKKCRVNLCVRYAFVNFVSPVFAEQFRTVYQALLCQLSGHGNWEVDGNDFCSGIGVGRRKKQEDMCGCTCDDSREVLPLLHCCMPRVPSKNYVIIGHR